MTIHPPNTHALWDSDWAEHLVDANYTTQIELGRELVRFGADLLLRALETGPDDIPNHMILSVLGRHAVSSLDAGLICLEAGTADAAESHARALMEVRWGLRYALQDPGKWGRHIYVASLRQQRHWTARLVLGTPEYEAYEEARRTNASFDPTDLAKQAEYNGYRAALDAILAKPEFSDINRGFEGYYKARHREAEWYYDHAVSKDRQVTSIARLAKSVGCAGEYQTIYKHSSYYVHGSYTGTHLKYEPGAVIIAPIRTPENWRPVFILIVAMSTDIFR